MRPEDNKTDKKRRDNKLRGRILHLIVNDKEFTDVHPDAETIWITPPCGESGKPGASGEPRPLDAGKAAENLEKLLQSIEQATADKKDKPAIYVVGMPLCRIGKKYWRYVPVPGEVMVINRSFVDLRIDHVICKDCRMRQYCTCNKNPVRFEGLRPLTGKEDCNPLSGPFRWQTKARMEKFHLSPYISFSMNSEGLHLTNEIYMMTVSLPLKGAEQADLLTSLEDGMTNTEIQEMLGFYGVGAGLFWTMLQGCVIE